MTEFFESGPHDICMSNPCLYEQMSASKPPGKDIMRRDLVNGAQRESPAEEQHHVQVEYPSTAFTSA